MDNEQSKDQHERASVTGSEEKKTRSPEELEILPKDVLSIADEQGLGMLWWMQRYFFISRQMGMKEFLFEEGIIRARGFPFFRSGAEVYRWSDVHILKDGASEYMRHDRDMGSVYSQFERIFAMEFHDGKTCTINLIQPGVRTWDQDFFRYGKRGDYPVSRAEQVTKLLSQKITQAQFERIRGTIEAGGEVNFGRVTATQKGISFDGRSFPWSLIDQIKLHLPTPSYALRSRYSVKVQNLVLNIGIKYVPGSAGNSERYFEIPASGIDNALALENLYEVMILDAH